MFKRYLSIPSKIPSKGLIKLNTSKFLQISGQDASSFINGLTTIKMLPQNIKKNQLTISAADLNNEALVKSVNLSPELINSHNWGILNESEEFDPEEPDEIPMRLGIRRDGRYALLLRSNGRIFSDVFIYPTPFLKNEKSDEPSYLIEVLNHNQFKSLQMSLKLHKLRSKVNIKELKLNSWFYFDSGLGGCQNYDYLLDNYFNNAISKDPEVANKLAGKFIDDEVLINPAFKDQIRGFTVDQRSDYFGMRIITNEINDNKHPLIDTVEILSPESYIERRIQKGVVESIDYGDIAALPFECNIDWMRGINYDKGCYVGQELTIRTWTGKGTARRVLPIKFNDAIPTLKNPYDKLELRMIEEKSSIKKKDAAVNNPFASSANPAKPVRARRDTGKVGEVLVNDGYKGLARIEKRYFDWDKELTKSVKVIHDGNSYMATIDAGIWNE